MAFGVDLGTTNSSIAWSDEAGNVESLRVRRGIKDPFDAVERSLVFDPLSDTWVVGSEAETAAAREPERRLVGSFKRRFDKPRLRGRHYRIVNVPTGQYDPVEQGIRIVETGQVVPIEYDQYSRDEVVAAGARVFDRLLTSTEIESGATGRAARSALEQLTAAARDTEETLYVGVPVSFGPTGRRRLLASLARSGSFGSGEKAYKRVLDRCRLVFEPLALVSTIRLFEPQNVIVFDYGGGTLDLAVLRVSFAANDVQTVTELALGGRARAGDALDTDFREYLLQNRPSLKKAYDRQVATGSDYDRLVADAAFANAKVRLSTADEALIPLFDETATRADLEAAIAPELDCVIDAIRETLGRAELVSEEIGTVLVTGGSSLIPSVQRRLHAEFPDLDDDLGFRAGTPGDLAGELEALTGVSRGLARFGFLERFEARAPCDYSILVPGLPGKTVCLPRGSDDVEPVRDSPAVAVPVRSGCTNTLALHSDLLHDSYCGALVDVEIPQGLEEVEVRVSASRRRFTPAFSITRPGRRRPLATFDLDGMSARALTAFVEGDSEWLPADGQPLDAPLVRPLRLGDFVRWGNGRSERTGKVVLIRELGSNAAVEEMRDFDPAHYVITVALERDGVVRYGHTSTAHWHSGDVRLA